MKVSAPIYFHTCFDTWLMQCWYWKKSHLSWCKTLLAWNFIVAASCTFWEAAWSSVFPDCAGEITYFLLMVKSHLSKQNVPSEFLQKLCGMRSIFSSGLRDCAAYRFAMQDANIESRSWIFFVDWNKERWNFPPTEIDSISTRFKFVQFMIIIASSLEKAIFKFLVSRLQYILHGYINIHANWYIDNFVHYYSNKGLKIPNMIDE